jgi:hypothetical protein
MRQVALRALPGQVRVSAVDVSAQLGAADLGGIHDPCREMDVGLVDTDHRAHPNHRQQARSETQHEGPVRGAVAFDQLRDIGHKDIQSVHRAAHVKYRINARSP